MYEMFYIIDICRCYDKDYLLEMKTHLRKFRFDRGELSQLRIAEMVSVSRQTIVAIERGDYSPSVKLALLLARQLETTVEELFELEDSEHD